MCRYECKSKLNISCQANSVTGKRTHSISIWLEHHKRHIPCYDVTLPSTVSEMIWENLEWTCPNEIAKKVQIDYPAVSTTQIYTAWSTMSESLWKRDTEQLPSDNALLGDFKGEVDVLDLPAMESVEQIAWVMKKIVLPLQGMIVEVGIDATCKKKFSRIVN